MVNPLLFPRSTQPFDADLFRNPTAEYRGCPLWAWNNRLRRDQLLRQIDHMADMGLGGFHIHSRTGLATPYMGPEFIGHAKACVERAAEKGMLACLYDEDRWPSGYGGGLVVKDREEFKALHLLLTTCQYGQGTRTDTQQGANATAVRSELGELVATYEIILDEAKTSVVSARRVSDEKAVDQAKGQIWYAYVESNPDSEWFNTGSYIDTLNKKAVSRFIETTHEVYADALSEHFGSTVPSIFTDEPQFAHKTQLRTAADTTDVFLPWTRDLVGAFADRHGYDLLDRIPGLIWDARVTSDRVTGQEDANFAATRYHFHDFVCELFADAFMDNIAGWCKEHSILLTGHMMKEPTLKSQTDAIGEAMRCYRSLDVPGVDMLTDLYEFNTVKQCSSVARQNGARGVMSEIYGVTNWTFDFAGHKASGDWQAALGITFRVHHLTWVSMAGEGKRDYPACIGYQSNWYKQYPYIENHFARLNVALTRGKPVTRVAVIHPIESFWLCFGPKDSSMDEMTYRDRAFEELTTWLLFGLLDFDFVSESLLPDQCPLESIVTNKLAVGKAEYEAVVVPNLRTIRSSTLSRLREFASRGGRVLVAGSTPELIDASIPTGEAPDAWYTEHVQFGSYHILKALEPQRDIRVTTDEGLPADKLLYQLRDDGTHKYLFLCNTDRVRYYPSEVQIRGEYSIDVMDTLTGKEWTLSATPANGWTSLSWHFEAIGSVLFRLTDISSLNANEPPKRLQQFAPRNRLRTLGTSVSLDRVSLSEPNVLLLDYGRWRIGDEPWSAEGEILRAENDVRRQLGLPLKLEALRQPWSQPVDKTAPVSEISVLFEFSTTVALEGAKMAIEDAPNVHVSVDDNKMPFPTVVSGWWVDEDIQTVDLPRLGAGTHRLILTYDFGLLTNLERVYVLGDFGVDLRGKWATAKEPTLDRMSFGDWTSMGLPFYAGNSTYHCSFTVDTRHRQRLWLEVPRFAGPVLEVSVPDHEEPQLRSQVIATQPHVVRLGWRSPGEIVHVDITCYGNRENSFGTVHKPDGTTRWVASNAWRAEHELWMEEYNVKQMGVLQRPRVKGLGKEVYHVRINPLKKWII